MLRTIAPTELTMSRQPTPAEYAALAIGKSIIALSRAMDGTNYELSCAHSAMCDAVEAAPSGPDRHWLACESIMCAMREATMCDMKVGGLLVACEEARDAITGV